MLLAPFFTKLIELEQQVSDAAKLADPANEMRVYPWRPTKLPELPAIWNWIEDGDVDNVDTAREDDVLVLSVTIGVLPTDIPSKTDQLVTLTDHLRQIFIPAFKQGRPLDGTAKTAQRTVTRTAFDEFGDTPVLCMETLLRVQFPLVIP